MLMRKITEIKEFIAFDIVRGVAVILMIFAHTIAFFSDNSNLILNLLRSFGDTFAFVIFLFVSGCVTYISFNQTSFAYIKSRRKRILHILLIYYILAFVPYIKDGLGSFINHLVPTLLFYDVPNFTEFLIPFIVFAFFCYKPQVVRRLTKSPTTLIIIAILCQLISLIFYDLDMGILNPYKAILIGSNGFYRFPIINYFPLFILSCLFAKHYIVNPIKNTRIFIASMGLLLMLFVIFYKLSFVRWPPNPPYLLLGAVFALMLISTYKFYNFKLISFMGKNSILMVLFHLIIINLIDIFTYKTYNNMIVILSLFTGILMMSIFSTKFFNVFKSFIYKKKKL